MGFYGKQRAQTLSLLFIPYNHCLSNSYTPTPRIHAIDLIIASYKNIRIIT